MDGDFYTPVANRNIFTVTADEWPQIQNRYGAQVRQDNNTLPVTTKAAYEEACWMHYPYLMAGKEGIDDIVEAILKVQQHAEELL